MSTNSQLLTSMQCFFWKQKGGGTSAAGAEGGGQGVYNSGKHGKHGNLREFVNSGKHRENSGNLKFTQGIYQIVSLGHRVMCIIVSNSSVHWLGDTVTGVDGASHHVYSIKYSVILQESCRTEC